ncbi:MAG: hemin uptake protein HemP [Bacteroidia bacterium]|nr:hemin uptake protein HemP [Methylotenera sp.]
MLNNTKPNTNKNDAKNGVIAAARSVTSEALFAGEREMVIQHAGHEYRLRLTAQDKLILTK